MQPQPVRIQPADQSFFLLLFSNSYAFFLFSWIIVVCIIQSIVLNSRGFVESDLSIFRFVAFSSQFLTFLVLTYQFAMSIFTDNQSHIRAFFVGFVNGFVAILGFFLLHIPYFVYFIKETRTYINYGDFFTVSVYFGLSTGFLYLIGTAIALRIYSAQKAAPYVLSPKTKINEDVMEKIIVSDRSSNDKVYTCEKCGMVYEEKISRCKVCNSKKIKS